MDISIRIDKKCDFFFDNKYELNYKKNKNLVGLIFGLIYLFIFLTQETSLQHKLKESKSGENIEKALNRALTLEMTALDS